MNLISKELMKEAQRILPKLKEEAGKFDWMKAPQAAQEAASNSGPDAAKDASTAIRNAPHDS